MILFSSFSRNLTELIGYYLQPQEQLRSKDEGDTKIGVEVCMNRGGKEQEEENQDEEYFDYTMDGSLDIRGQPAAKGRTGGWVAGSLVLGT